MHRKLFLLIIALFIYIIGPVMGQEVKKDRPKVAVVLCGGGAKGFAHIGVLKVLEEAGIPVDYVTGTSMGAIVGGLYSVGYKAGQIDSLVKMQDWGFLLSDNVRRSNLPLSQKGKPEYLISLPYEVKFKERSGRVRLPSGVISGHNLYSLFLNLTLGYHQPMNFDDLPIPFGCIAADSRTGSEVVFREGVLAEAMRASMAIPGMFAPIEIDSMLLIDGGVVNNYPVDLAKKMGADVVIGVAIPKDKKTLEANRGSMSEIMEELGNFIGKEKWDNNIKNTDILIAPDLHSFGMMDFEGPAADTIIARGEQAARAHWDELIALKNSLGVSAYPSSSPPVRNRFITMDTLQIQKIDIQGISPEDEKYVLNFIAPREKITRRELENMVSSLYGTDLFSKVFYQLEGDSVFDLVFHVKEKDFKTLNLGIRFDTEDMAAILANTTIRFNSMLRSMVDVRIRLSKNPYLQADYSINRGIFYKGGVSYFIGRNRVSLYDRGKLAHSYSFTRNTFGLNFSEFHFYNMKLHLGVNFEYYHYFDVLQNQSGTSAAGMRNKGYVNYFLEGMYDNLDRSNYPTAGQLFSFRYAILTDNFYQMNHRLPVSVFQLSFMKPVKLSDQLYVTPSVNARIIFNDSVPAIYRNYVGGVFDGHSLPQQIALPGSRGMEMMKNSVATVALNFRFALSPNRFLHANANMSVHNDQFYKLPGSKLFWGGNIGYSQNTIVGPIRLELGYSSLSLGFYPFASIGYYF
ncbi:MAG TPA: patatin [Porphyromonadaceae bacterium]|nr:patatin [Porphyromonadaceae bacterium]HBL32390.1 patatin [Porphyromonadaceae bacterium]HCM19884.1 patatin [Porphyromonadaceae bacterium]